MSFNLQYINFQASHIPLEQTGSCRAGNSCLARCQDCVPKCLSARWDTRFFVDAWRDTPGNSPNRYFPSREEEAYCVSEVGYQ